MLASLQLAKHPDKMCSSRVTKEFDFLGDPCSLSGLRVGTQTLANSARLHQLDAHEREKLSGSSALGSYVRWGGGGHGGQTAGAVTAYRVREQPHSSVLPTARAPTAVDTPATKA